MQPLSLIVKNELIVLNLSWKVLLYIYCQKTWIWWIHQVMWSGQRTSSCCQRCSQMCAVAHANPCLCTVLCYYYKEASKTKGHYYGANPGEAKNVSHIQGFKHTHVHTHTQWILFLHPVLATNCRGSGTGDHQDFPSKNEEPPTIRFLEGLIRNCQPQGEFQSLWRNKCTAPILWPFLPQSH